VCLPYVLIRFTPSIILPHPPPTPLRTISTSFIVLFSYTNTKGIQYIHPLSLSLFTLLSSTSTHSWTRPVLHFFKCVLTVQGGFALVFHTCPYHSLIRLPRYYLLFLHHPALLLVNSSQCIPLFYLHTQMHRFSIIHHHSLFLYHLLEVPSDRPTIKIMFSLFCIRVCVNMYICDHTCICLISLASTYKAFSF
jgi:hypothetical protein